MRCAVGCDLLAGAGEGGLARLMGHAFFSGVDWAGLREAPAPAFARPQRDAHVDDVGLDWEMTSLVAALPVTIFTSLLLCVRHHQYMPKFNMCG